MQGEPENIKRNESVLKKVRQISHQNPILSVITVLAIISMALIFPEDSGFSAAGRKVIFGTFCFAIISGIYIKFLFKQLRKYLSFRNVRANFTYYPKTSAFFALVILGVVCFMLTELLLVKMGETLMLTGGLLIFLPAYNYLKIQHKYGKEFFLKMFWRLVPLYALISCFVAPTVPMHEAQFLKYVVMTFIALILLILHCFWSGVIFVLSPQVERDIGYKAKSEIWSQLFFSFVIMIIYIIIVIPMMKYLSNTVNSYLQCLNSFDTCIVEIEPEIAVEFTSDVEMETEPDIAVEFTSDVEMETEPDIAVEFTNDVE